MKIEPAPPITLTITLTEDELVALWGLSYTSESGGNFPLHNKLLYVIEKGVGWTHAQATAKWHALPKPVSWR